MREVNCRANRKRSRSRVDWSAQWTSSMMSSSGVSALSWVSAPCRASYNAVRPVGSMAWSDSVSRRCAGSSRAIAGLAATRDSASAGLSVASRPSASLNGRYGGELSPKSRQCPTSTRQPCDRARSLNSATSRLLPAPASPPSTTRRAAEPRPSRLRRAETDEVAQRAKLIDSPDQGRGTRVERHACHHDGHDHQVSRVSDGGCGQWCVAALIQ